MCGDLSYIIEMIKFHYPLATILDTTSIVTRWLTAITYLGMK